MTDVVQQQTEQLLKALTALHSDLTNTNITISIIGTIVIALLMIIAFRRRRD
jgi:LPXTG-motif cell wall-anchored protein